MGCTLSDTDLNFVNNWHTRDTAVLAGATVGTTANGGTKAQTGKTSTAKAGSRR